MKSFPSILATAASAMVIIHSSVLAQSAPEDIDTLRRESLDLVNSARSDGNLEALELQADLNEAAQAHAEDMLERDFYAHVSPDGETVMDRYTAAGGSPHRLVAENIARCRNCTVPADDAAVRQLHEAWMDSPGHRENILARGLSGYGFGIAEDASGTRYSVQTFSGPGTPRGLEPGETANRIDAAAQTELAASLINEHRDTEEAIGFDAQLVEAARQIIPGDRVSELDLDELIPLQEALPQGAPWRTYHTITGSCGGCGVSATDADTRFFVEQWLNEPRYRNILTDEGLSSLGVVIEADGQGRKIAVAVLAG